MAPAPEIGNRQVTMKPFFRSVAYVIVAAAALAAAWAPMPTLAQEAREGLTPEQAEQARRLLQPGAAIPPDIQKLLEARPELRERLLQESTKKDGEERKGKEEAKEAAVRPEPVALPMYDWKASVYVRGLFLSRLTREESVAITHFGHDFFTPRQGTAAILEDMPVAPGYVVGPGDEIVVRTWGRLEGTNRLTVDRDGKVFYPKIGSLHVAGKSFGDLQAFIKSKVGTIAETRADVSMGQLKAVRVSVLGEVRAPGWYNVSSLHTALQALYLAGGVKDAGSLRRIEVRRGGRSAERIDLYDFMLKGDTQADIRLLPGDAIFVPVVGALAAVAGEVRRPAIYELNGEKTLAELIRMAGGFSPTAYKKRVQVERLEKNASKVILDADAEDLEKGGAAFALADGDIVRVFPILLAEENAVILEGNVVRPGRYELKPGMTVGSLLPDERAFLPETYFDYALVTRLVPPDLHKEVLPVNLRAIVLDRKKDADVALAPRDTLKVFPRAAFRDRPKATISGEVRMTRPEVARPLAIDNLASTGKDALTGKVEKEARADKDVISFDLFPGARVSDLVKLAGGLTKLAALDRAEVVRVDAGRAFRTIYFDLGKAVSGDPKEDLPLEDEDHVRIHSIYETRYKKPVFAAGELNAPGEYVLTEGMKLSDLLFKAGGFKESAYVREAELIRREMAPGGELVKTQTLVVSPERAMGKDAAFDTPLKEYDLLVVRAIPEWAEKVGVTLAGEVRFPGIYAAKKGERLSSLIARAGGFTPDAYLKGAQFTRESTRKSQQEAIDRLIEDLELEVAQKAQAATSAALDREDIETSRELMNARRGLISQLRKARAKGRVIIRLADADKLKGSSADILLEDGDRLDIPKKMNTVNVVGRVYNPTGVVYDPANDTVRYYLDKVGGPTATADRSHIFQIKADGSVVTKETAEGGFLGGGLMSAKVEPGDSIVVPEKLIETRLMKDVKDITQILYQIAVTAGVLIVAF